MKDDRFDRLKDLLLRVADLSENERRIHLDEACRDDPELRKEIESLLAYDSDLREFLKTAGMIPGAPGDLPPADRKESLIGQQGSEAPAAEFWIIESCHHLLGINLLIQQVGAEASEEMVLLQLLLIKHLDLRGAVEPC